MITSTGFSNFGIRLKFCLAAVLIGAIVGSYFGFVSTTKNLTKTEVQFFTTYIVAKVVTSAGFNHSIAGEPTKFRKELDAMESTQPKAVLEADSMAKAIFIYPWLSIGSAIGFFVFSIINYSLGRRHP